MRAASYGDHRFLLEYSDDVIFAFRRSYGPPAPTRHLRIEDNKPDSIDIMEPKTAAIPNIEVVVAKTK
jgi:hypothetical protein